MINFYRVFNILWNSPTLMTWCSFLSRTLNLVLVIPLILTKFSTPEITLWFLFSSIISMQMLVDMGFSPTFSRFIAYAMGGASSEQLGFYRLENKLKSNHTPNWRTLESIYATMSLIYSWLAILLIFIFITFGTLSLIRPISFVVNTTSAWTCWAIIIVVSAINLRGNCYSSYLQGTNNIALLRRWEMIISLCSIFSIFCVLLIGGGLLSVVTIHQFWRVFNVLINRHISFNLYNRRISFFNKYSNNRVLLKSVWKSTWRSGLGIFMSRGLIDGSGILYANLGANPKIATYLIALRFIQMISQFAQAPFYSKLPMLSKLRYIGNIQDQIKTAKKGMALSYWSFVLPFIGIGIFGPYILMTIKSNAQFPDPILWALLGVGMFIERYGAMHIQLYSTTNHIIWHKANGITGLIFIISASLLFNFIDVYAFPLSLIAGYLMFYGWYAAVHSYKSLLITFYQFEKDVLFYPTIVLAVFCLIYII
jgi:hypothetical protein